MDNETGAQTQSLHSLIPFADFKTPLGVDDRDDVMGRYCLLAATFTIEQYCKRRLLLKRHFERIAYNGDLSSPLRGAVRFTSPLTRRNEELLLPLREYPVREVCYLATQTPLNADWTEIEPEFYRVIPELEGETGEGPGTDAEATGRGSPPADTVYSLSLSPALLRGRGLSAVKAVYRAGYACGEAPADLASACLELAAWNMARYRGRRIGITGNVRGSGKDGEHLEPAMPENVRLLLEPYMRRVI